MNWDDLKYALAVHEHGGLSGAARHLGVNHATISRRLTSLEESLGVKLFDRLPGGLSVTAHGLSLVDTARSLSNDICDLQRQIAGKDQELAGPLKVSAPQLILKYVLADFLADYARQHPDINLSIMATSDAVNLQQREADISIRACNTPEESLWGRKIATQQRAWYAHRDYLRDVSRDSPVECLHFDWYGTDILPEVAAQYANAVCLARYDDMVAVHGAVCDKQGIARMPCFLGNSHPDLVIVPDLPIEPYLDLWVLIHPDLKNVVRIRHFMRAIEQELAAKQSLFDKDTA